jgi:monoamine oxidase
VIDLAVVGGGTAGIAAAREAKARGLSALILEASDRVGGRVHSLSWREYVLDLGATWLHSAERNPLVPVADQLNIQLDRSQTRWREQFHNLGISKEEQAESRFAIEEFTERLTTNPPSSDRASDALVPGSEWDGALNAFSNFLNGTGLENVSAADFTAYWNSSGDQNWRIPTGLGSFVELVGSGLDIRINCAIRKIEFLANAVRLVSDRGQVEAKHAIVAVPTSILASGAIDFPSVFDPWLHAASQLPLGHVEKLFFDLPDSESFPVGAHLLGNPRTADTGSYILRPIGSPVIEGFFGGDWLKSLIGEDVAAKAREELGHLLGADFARSVHPVAYSDWQRRSFICGSYSYARPGQHGARAALAKPVNERLAFAGEACAENDYATVHGAWASGKAAVEQLFGERR